MRDAIYQVPGFHFRVSFYDNPAVDTSFQEVSGLAAKMDVESVAEGGENRFSHRLPKPVSHSNLILKRGIAVSWSPLVRWCKEVLEGGFEKPIKPKSLDVHLLDFNSEPMRIWSVQNAIPISWEVEAFNATKNEVAIEKIELSYTGFQRTK